MKKFRKAMNVSFVLIPIMMFIVGIPMFYFIFTVKDINNTKKVLQEASYAGALAGTYAIDIVNFQNGTEYGRSTTVATYPNDKESKTPASFMKQVARTMRTRTLPSNHRDALSGNDGTRYTGSNDNLAAKEIVNTIEEYLDKNLNKIAVGKRAVYSSEDYSIAMKFERDGLESPSGQSISDDGLAPFNKVTVSVVLNYKPTLLQGLNMFGDTFDEPIPIYGTSTAKTKTIL